MPANKVRGSNSVLETFSSSSLILLLNNALENEKAQCDKGAYTEFVRSCIPTQLDLAVDTSTQLLDDHVLVNHLVSSHGIILLHHLVGFFDGLRGGRCDGSPR